MRRNRVDVLGVSEMRWAGKGELQSDEFLLIYTGDRGMVFILTSQVKIFVAKVKCFSDRVIMVRLNEKEKIL